MEHKYRIKVEAIDGNNEELDERYRNGIECDGFVIIGDTEDGTHVAIHRMNIKGIGGAISNSDQLYAASFIAQGYKKANAIASRSEMKGLEDLFRGLSDND